MAQFIQSNQLSPVQGSAGQQSVVQNQAPTAGQAMSNAVKNIGGILDTAGNIYGKNKAQELVNEEVQNIDKARSVAETGQFTAGDAVPDSIKMDQKEWDMIATAVQSGTMSREKARLLASSRLRTRISEEPFFADRMRKAASGLLGFNIESQGAQQYFASFPTQASLSSGGENDYLKKLSDQADAWAQLNIIDDKQTGMEFLARRDKAEAENKVAELQAKAGVRDANDMANTLITNHNSIAWGGIIGDLAAKQAEGQTITPETFTGTLKTQKQMFKEAFDKSWIAVGGDLDTPEYNRHLERINTEYSQMEDFVKEFGVDNLMKIKIDRQEQLYKMMGMEMFPQLTMINKTFGSQVTSDLINLSAMNKSKRDLLMSQNPELAAAFNLLGNDPKKFTKQLMGTASKILSGQQLTEEDTPYIDYTVTTMHQNGGKDTKKSIIQGLADSNMNWKALSTLAEGRAYLEPEENKKYFKTQYEEGLPAAVNQLALELQGTPGMKAEVNDQGNVVVSIDSAGTGIQTGTGGLVTNPQQQQEQIVAMNRAQQLADKINVFNKAMGRGYAQVVGTTVENYRADLASKLDQSVKNVTTQRNNQFEVQLMDQLSSNDIEAAKATYQKLQQRDPQLYNKSWQQMIDEAMQLPATQGGQ